MKNSFSKIIMTAVVLGSLVGCGQSSIENHAVEIHVQNNTQAVLQKSWVGQEAVPYYISNNVPDEFVPVIQEAFQDWEEAVGRSLVEYRGRTDAEKEWDGKNVISWNREGDTQGHLGMTYRKFSGNTIIESDIEIFRDPATYAVLNCPAGESNCRVREGRYDIKTNLLHEMGHFFGLEHTTIAGSIMNPNYGMNTVVHTLDTDLVAELQDVYGSYYAFNEADHDHSTN
ncbi:MAG: matrixin family metalloprotease [Deltaproteobacteria bacterium]|nr:MAG: matrixin family metalloprotease [Deltaproteobacteria bacterium]